MRDVGHAPVAIAHVHGVGCLPARQLAVVGDDDLVAPRSLAVVDDGGLAVARHKAGAAKHAVAGEFGLQRGRVPRPVDHVGATHMHEGKRLLPLPRLCHDVVQVVDAVDAKGRIGVSGQTGAARVHQVVAERGHIGSWK